MHLRAFVLFPAVLTICPAAALADEHGAFAGLDVSSGTAKGSSSQRDAGALFAGGGVVNHVKLGGTNGIGGHVGYQFDRTKSVFISYEHTRGDIRWAADFPFVGVASDFDGSAITEAVMANFAYERPLSDKAAIRATAGVGVAFNTLSGIVETDRGTGIFLDDVAKHTKTSAAGQMGVGLRYRITSYAALGLDASVAYSGGFETGDTRLGNLGVTDINPYQIDDVWRTNLGASIRFDF